MSLADYLAKNYLTADPPADKKSKKRKRKAAKNNPAGLIIADDDISGWNTNTAENDDDDAPMIVGTTTETRKSKPKSTTTWKTIGVPAPSTTSQLAADEAAAADADAIIASTAAARTAAAAAEDEAPEMVDADNILRMESGAHAGLQTGAQVAAALKQRREEERRRAAEVTKEVGGGAAETIYRDASGRVINVAMKRAEARRKMAEEEAARVERERAARGDVQRVEVEKRREALREARYMPVARHADDVALNEELRGKERWNDPAAGFLVKKKAGKSATGKPLYKGAAPPNRHGIRPGYRWDGVDRGNGFEAEWFKARNRKSNRAELEYAWQMDE
ncbi:Pre-mRNA-splicing factor of RES complex-domain-containing protein [Cenococcum geophilum]